MNDPTKQQALVFLRLDHIIRQLLDVNNLIYRLDAPEEVVEDAREATTAITGLAALLWNALVSDLEVNLPILDIGPEPPN